MKVLILKLTSMGDLMHALPALTEAEQNIKNISFDWVVDKAFSSVPSWHPAVDKIIKTDHRHWKKQFFSSESREALNLVKKEINATDYDFVVDMQNNLKSAFLSFLSNHRVTGMDASSSREYPAHWAYYNKVNINKSLHAIDRQKELLASSLGYSPTSGINYGISKVKFLEPAAELPANYVVLVQNASWLTKQWPVAYWKDLIKHLDDCCVNVLLPSGNKEELMRAKDIVSVSEQATALEILPLNEVAYIIDNADYCICSDTGLAHLSAVVNTPSLTLYGPTDTKLIGTKGNHQIHIIGDNGDINNIKVSEVIDTLERNSSLFD
jgi:heptosyltransferase-1